MLLDHPLDEVYKEKFRKLKTAHEKRDTFQKPSKLITTDEEVYDPDKFEVLQESGQEPTQTQIAEYA